jgi:hypothetical protein
VAVGSSAVLGHKGYYCHQRSVKPTPIIATAEKASSKPNLARTNAFCLKNQISQRFANHQCFLIPEKIMWPNEKS